MYKVDKKIAESLDTVVYEHGRNDYIILFSAGIALIIRPLLDTIFLRELSTPKWIHVVIAGIYTILLIIWRIHRHHISHQQLNEKVDLLQAPVIRVRVKPIYLRQFLLPVFVLLLIALFIIGSIRMMADDNTLMSLYSYAIFLPIWLYGQHMFFSTEAGKTNTYRIKILK